MFEMGGYAGIFKAGYDGWVGEDSGVGIGDVGGVLVFTYLRITYSVLLVTYSSMLAIGEASMMTLCLKKIS